MPSGEEIQRNLHGAWRLMTGKADGLRLLDISADGFWNSFLAMVIALPALAVGWLGIMDDFHNDPGGGAGRLSVLVRLAVVDFSAWLVPLLLLAALARRLGLADRFVHYVIASNWASALIVWMMLPPAVLRLFAPSATEFTSVLSLVLFLASGVLTWRLTTLAIGKGKSVGTAVFAGMFAASLAVLFLAQSLLGLQLPGDQMSPG